MVRKLAYTLAVFLLLCAIALASSRLLVASASKGRLYTDASRIPHRRVGLVLGCPKRVTGGWSNPFFENRMAAAAELYRQRKVDFLIVSGDNHIQGYDEPTDMKEALIERGVPSSRIYLDYAGFRTLDSVTRVKEIFLQDKITIVSQRFHNERAIFLASHDGIDAIGFDAADVAFEYALKTLLREQLARVKAALDVYVLHTKPHFLGRKIAVGYPRATLGAKEAERLAKTMCAQLPNLGAFVEHLEVGALHAPGVEPDTNLAFGLIGDDTFDALFRLGSYSVPCLVDRLDDTRWMPDPRTEPLSGAPLVADVAYMVLLKKGVPDLLPALAHQKNMRMDEYFRWPSSAGHRKQLQNAVRTWVREHPACCGDSEIDLRAASAQPVVHMTEDQVVEVGEKFRRLRPGMDPEEVLRLVGAPDAEDRGDVGSANSQHSPMLLGGASNHRNEKLAYIYFTERWADEISRRDPLHDSYVILYFSGQDRFIRMFSNVPEIAPMVPSDSSAWKRMAGGDPLQAVAKKD
jgi:SanA protein